MDTNNLLVAILYTRGSLEILDQLLLPFESTYVEIKTIQECHRVIKSMQVRGAPAIAIVAALSLAIVLDSKRINNDFTDGATVKKFINAQLEVLKV
jgi:methylthioribose-1-phosphate isomerase